MKYIIDLIQKYFSDDFFGGFHKKESDGIVLLKSHDSFFDFKEILSQEVSDYLKKENIEINEIKFVSCFNVDFGPSPENPTSVFSEAESKIEIIEKDGKIIARIFFGEINKF